jgi:putative membrane protein
LLTRFNFDPILIATLVVLGGFHIRSVRSRASRTFAAAGWLVAFVAFVSPLCALSVSLFSARVAQHMVLILVAAPLIAAAYPRGAVARRNSTTLWVSAVFFFIALWFWHMPVPYDSTFDSTSLYWTMHATLFGSSIVLWRELLNHRHEHIGGVLIVGALTSMQMGLLGAILMFAARPLFFWHLTTTWAWGFTPLRDQQLGGVIMWVPGIILFLWAALRSLGRVWINLEKVTPV